MEGWMERTIEGRGKGCGLGDRRPEELEVRQEEMGDIERSWRRRWKRRMGRWREVLQTPAAGDGTCRPHALAAAAGWSPRAGPPPASPPNARRGPRGR